MIFQAVFLLFSLFAIWSVYRRYQDQTLGWRGVAFWTLFWVGVVGVILYPESSQYIADTLGIGRGADLILYSGMAVIFFVLFRLHIKLEGLKRDITKVARQEALRAEKNTRV